MLVIDTTTLSFLFKKLFEKLKAIKITCKNFQQFWPRIIIVSFFFYTP